MQVVTLEIAQSISFSGLNYQFEPPKESVYQLDYPWLDLENMQSEGILQLENFHFIRDKIFGDVSRQTKHRSCLQI